MQKPAIILQPLTHQKFQEGVQTLVNAIRPTLGPMPRVVALQSIVQEKGIELLDNGGLIARRMIQLPDRTADVGAMFLRHILWEMSESMGDGTATTAVLFESIFSGGLRYLAAGGNAMRLREALEAGLDDILRVLKTQVRCIQGERELTQIARSLCFDSQLAAKLSEVFQMMGSNGRLEIRSGRDREVTTQYVRGSYWSSGLLSPKFVNQVKTMRGELCDCHVLLTDFEINTPQELLPLLRLVKTAGIKRLVIFAKKLSDVAIGVLQSASNDPAVFQAIAVALPGKSEQDQMIHAEDLSAITGGRFLASISGETLQSLQAEDLGHVRRLWANKSNFAINGFGGDPQIIRQHLERLKLMRDRSDSKSKREKLQSRIEILSGGTAVLHIGAATESEMKWRAAQAKRAASTLRQASRSGVLPGGGMAYFQCQDTLRERAKTSADPAERAAYQILLKALSVPLRTIAQNAGHDPSEVIARLQISAEPAAFNVLTGKIMPQSELGLWDAAGVVTEAITQAVKGAALALTTDVIVHHRHPEQAQEP